MILNNLEHLIQTDTDNTLNRFKSKGYKVKSFRGLKIISYPYDKEIDDEYVCFSRGLVIDTSNKKMICIPPRKSINVDKIDDIEMNENYVFEELIDGTMINVFWYQDQWLISTRTEIGGYNKWNGNKSFRTLFEECLDFKLDQLNPEYSYSFVMRHTENRNISPIQENELYLVEMYHGLERMEPVNYPTFCKTVCMTKDIQVIKYNLDNSQYLKGYTLKLKDKRYKIVNHNFEKIKKIKINRNNLFLTYLDLRKNGKLKEFLIHFTEHTSIFENYRDKVHMLSNDIYSNYKDTFIYKKKEKKDIPYHLKPFIYEIHQLYLKDKKPIQWNDIKTYIHQLKSERIYFSISHGDY